MSAALTYDTEASRMAAMKLSNRSQPRENSQGLGILLCIHTGPESWHMALIQIYWPDPFLIFHGIDYHSFGTV